MSLNETGRALTPQSVAALVQWQHSEGCIIILKGKTGEPNHIVMSSLTVEEVSLLKCQLDEHVNRMLFNSLIEGVPDYGPSTKNKS